MALFTIFIFWKITNMIFSRMLNASTKTLSKIYNHAYVHSLHNGTLPRQKFKTYLQQDGLYLLELVTTLKLIAAKLTDDRQRTTLNTLATATIGYERTMLAQYLNPQGPEFFQKKEIVAKIPAVETYTSHLLQTAENADAAIAMACILPCFWSYCSLGQQIAEKKISIQPTHPYYCWILCYTDKEYNDSVTALINITETLANTASPEVQEQMIVAFSKSCEYELGFYEAILPHEPEQTLQNTFMKAS
jgi:thiaminase